jgi:hypothetical protein
MKANKYTIAMLIALSIGFINVQGQRPIRSETRADQNKKEQKTVHRLPVEKRKATRQVKPDNRQREATKQRESFRPQEKYQANRSKEASRSSAYKKPEQVTEYSNHKSKVYAREHTPRQKHVETKAYRKHTANKHYAKKRYYSGHHYHYAHPSRRIKTHFHYDTYKHHYRVLYYPAYHEIYWNRRMYHDYRTWYPSYRWRYDYGYRIQTISAFEANYNLGEVAMVFGRVSATWYNRDTDDYLLFFGGDYPNQAFTMVLPGRIARKFARRPERYFLGEHMTVTGLITTYDGVPEIIVKNKKQVGLY